MSERLTTFAWRHARRDQVLVVLVTLLTFPTIYITLELPKRIINDAINGTAFPVTVLGRSFTQLEFLFLLCGAYLLAIAVNNGLKFYLNLARGIMGERLLRRMRFDLFRKVMSRRLARLRTTSPGEVVQMISSELAPIGDFVGAIFATPLLQGGSFLVFLGFIIAQNAFIGVAALSLYPVQAYVIPKLQGRVVAMITRRLANLRAIAREIGESIDGATEVRALQAGRWHMALLSERLYENYLIRRRIFVLKYLIKFTNNVADHLTPFMIFLIGGYFVIQGRLDVGALTAVLIAYKDLSSPWRELLAYYQDYGDMSQRYRTVQAQFADEGVAPPPPGRADGGLALSLTRAEAEGLHGPLTCVVPKDATTVVICEDDGTRLALLQAMAGVLELDRGTLALADGRPPVIVTPEARAFSGSLRYNILHGLYAMPVRPASDEEADLRRREAALTGAPPDDVRDTWIDARALGFDDDVGLEARLMRCVQLTDLEPDLYAIGMGSHIDPAARPDLAASLLEMRRSVAADPELAPLREDFIDVWQAGTYNANGTLGENLFFARPADAQSGWTRILGDRDLRRALDRSGILPVLRDIGIDICTRLLSLFEGIGEQSELLSQYGLFAKSETPLIERIVTRARARGAGKLGRADTMRMVALSLQYSSARYRLRVMQDDRRDRLMAAQAALRATAAGDVRFSAFDPEGYVAAFSVSENLFFGPVRSDRRASWRPFADRIDVLATERGLRPGIVEQGLAQPVGDSGVTLNSAQRRKVALARALMMRPGALVLDGLHATPSDADRAFRSVLRADLGPGALIFGSPRAEVFSDVQHVIRLDGQSLAEGPPDPGPRQELSGDMAVKGRRAP